MTIRVEVKSIQKAVSNAGRALSEKYQDQFKQYDRDQLDRYGQYNTEESQRLVGILIPQQWRAEYNADLILELHPIRDYGLFAKYVDFESEKDYAWFVMRWS
jgi:hypothetical protein